METIGNLADKALQSASATPTKTSSKPGRDEFKRLLPLWEHMTGIYGHKWASTYGAEVSETWVRGCRDLDSEALARGLRTCLDWNGNDGWPPALPQFRAMCRRPPARTYFQPLPKPPLTPEQLAAIDTERSTIRSVLRHARRERKREEYQRREFKRISVAAAREFQAQQEELLAHARKQEP